MNLEPSPRLKQWIFCLVIVVGPGCNPKEEGWSCGGGTTSAPEADTTMVNYNPGHMRLWATLAMADNTPETEISHVDHYSFYPAMPPGLTLDPATGTISGTPTAALPATEFTISVFGKPGESDTTSVTIEIFEAVAPSDFGYTPSSTVVEKGHALTPLEAHFTGAAQSFGVQPNLPPGLHIDPLTGMISGWCGGQPGLGHYTVTVTNPFGSAQTDVEIEVLDEIVAAGLLVPSAGDGTLDIFRNTGSNGFVPIDAQTFGVAAPLDAVATHDGRWIFVATTNGRIHAVGRDPLSGYCRPAQELEGTSAAYKLAITPDDAYLLAAFDTVVTRYQILADGTLANAIEVLGPFAPTAILAGTSTRLLVGSGYPAQVWCYDIAPEFALRGLAAELAVDTSVAKLVDSLPGSRAIALTNTYDFDTHELSGMVRELRMLTDEELSANTPGVVQTYSFDLGANLSDACIEPPSGFERTLRITDANRGCVYSIEVPADGILQQPFHHTFEIGGHPTGVLDLPHMQTLVLDGTAATISRFDLYVGSVELLATQRTRSYPIAMLPLFAPAPRASADTVFVSSAVDATLLALRIDVPQAGLLTVSAQGPLATGAEPCAIATSEGLPFVYTANRSGASISAFRFDDATLELSPLGSASLPAGSHPIALALTPGGSHLYALDAGGSVIALQVDAEDGSLTQTGSEQLGGSMAEAYLRMDALARFLFVVQPAEGRVTAFGLSLPWGAPSWASASTGLGEPIDVLLSPDGRLLTLLDRASARLEAYEIDALGGELSALPWTISAGAAPVCAALNDPVPSYPLPGFEDLRVLDGASNGLLPIERTLISGAMVEAHDTDSLLLPGTRLFVPVKQLGRFPHFLGISGDRAGERLSVYDYVPLPGPQADIETDALVLGQGLHAVAVRPHAGSH